MLKSLATVVVLFVSLIAHVDAQKVTSPAPQTQIRKHPSPPAPPALQPNTNQEQSGSQGKPFRIALPQRDKYDWISYGANLLLVGVGIGGIVVGVLTLRKIDRQTRATEDAAKAALGQVELMKRQMDMGIHRERARLSLDTQPIHFDDVSPEGFRLFSCIELTNSGHSNAHIRFSAARFVIVPSGQWPLPEVDPDEFATGSNTIEPLQSPVYAAFDVKYAQSTPERFAEKIWDATLRIHLYGFIEYETMGIEWHRDFGYIWTIEDSIRDPSTLTFRSRRNPEEIYFAGEWEQDVRQENTEYQMKPNQDSTQYLAV